MNGRSKQLWLLVGLAVALGLGPGASVWAQIDPGNRIVTTHSQIPVDVFVIGPNDKTIHFTGSFEMLARVTVGNPDIMPAHVELVFNAGGVRGESEARGFIVDWKPAGLYRFIGNPELLPASFRVEATFPLFRAGAGERPQRVGSLGVLFEVTVGRDGGATGSVIAIILNG